MKLVTKATAFLFISTATKHTHLCKKQVLSLLGDFGIFVSAATRHITTTYNNIS